MNNKTKYIAISVFGLLLLMSFQNCGKKMAFSGPANSVTDLGGAIDSGGEETQQPEGEDANGAIEVVAPPTDNIPEVDVPTSPNPEEVVEHTEEDILPACQQGQLQVMEFDVSFAKEVAPQGQASVCNWGNSGNLARRNEFIQARYEQTQILSLPAGATLCDMEFEFTAQGMWYDDHLIFALNDRVLMSTERFDNNFSSDAAGPIYEWSKIAGSDFAVGETHIYCNGSASTCELPSTDTKGTGQMSFPKSLFQKIMAVSPNRNLEFKVITTGDNDDATDCKHDPFAFKIKAYYR